MKHNQNSFIAALNLIYPDSFTYEKTTFVDVNTPCTITCIRHGDITKLPKVFLDRHRVACVLCKQESGASTKVILNTESFISKMSEVHGLNFDYSKFSFTKLKDIPDITCTLCGAKNNKSAYSLLKNGCSFCGKDDLSTQKGFQSRIDRIFGKNSLKIIDGTYKSSTLDVSVQCEKCLTVWTKNANALSQGYGCSYCHGRQTRYNSQSAVAFLKSLNNSSCTDLSEFNYIDVGTKYKFYCNNNKLSYSRTFGNIYQTKSLCVLCSASGVSNPELDIRKILDSFGVEYICNYRPDWMLGKELDIYIPSSSLAIEYNGTLYHHSSNTDNKFYNNFQKDKLYHFKKWKMCYDNNVTLLSIYDFYWHLTNKQSIYIDKIKHYLGLNTRIYARKCSIASIDNKVAYDFYDKNHLEGSGFNYKSSSSYALTFDGNIVMCATVGHFYNQSSKKYSLKLHRICTLNGFSVIGGITKLSKHIEKINGAFVYQITLSSGGSSLRNCSSYRFIGPRYFWVNLNTMEYYSRNKTQKSNLSKLTGHEINDNETEDSFMTRNNFLKVYDNGLAEIQF